MPIRYSGHRSRSLAIAAGWNEEREPGGQGGGPPSASKFNELDENCGEDVDQGDLLMGTTYKSGRIQDIVKAGLVVGPRDRRGLGQGSASSYGVISMAVTQAVLEI